uniref:NAD(P)-binding protein n=1 Tax=Paramoeba aestuarina TaxID=180227 RepID=A0A7S4JG23_9EUKA|mmetsp:Transcript_10066/g.15207  ORF Transcript_10066/g.15207 Transcript_10066/m.15207 type:complete len:283 (+) Transcript_10066:2-850(+)
MFSLSPCAFRLARSAVRRYSTEHPSLLANRTCLVTNCDNTRNRYLPNQIAQAYASHGARVLVEGGPNSDLNSLISSLPTPTGQKHDLLISSEKDHGDPIGGPQSIKEKLANITDSIDVLVNNPGTVDVPPVGFDQYPVEEFDRIVRLNLTAPFALVKEIIPLLEKGQAANIILTSTEVDYPHTEEDETVKVGGAYYVSQFSFRASHMLAKLLALELHGRKISVNTIDPGRVFLFKTPIAIPGDSDRTVPYVWLARPNTQLTGDQIDVKDWFKRDPSMFTKGY